MSSHEAIERYYDGFADRLARDYCYGNRRVEMQYRFLCRSIPRSAGRVLVAGCGIGDVAARLARRSGPGSAVLGVDISSRAVELASRLFSHPRLSFERRDLLESPLPEPFDVIVLPDVYEHIPRDERPDLHRHLASSLRPIGRLLITCPTVWHQEHLRDQGSGLQVVDEDVSLDDLVALARDVGGSLTGYQVLDVFHRADYFHAVIDRGAKPMSEIVAGPDLRSVGGTARRAVAGLMGAMRVNGLISRWRCRRVRRAVEVLERASPTDERADS